MKKLIMFKKLRDKIIDMLVKRLRKKLKGRLIAFILYGSCSTVDFTLGSDIDCFVITSGEEFRGTSVNHYIQFLASKVYSEANQTREAKVLQASCPVISLVSVGMDEFKKNIVAEDPFTLDIINFGKILYKKRDDDIKNLFIRKAVTNYRDYIKSTFQREVKSLLVIYVKQFIKKCLLIGRRMYFFEGKQSLNREQIAKLFDHHFVQISNHVSLVKLKKHLNEDLMALSISQLTEIVKNCNSFILLTEKSSNIK